MHASFLQAGIFVCPEHVQVLSVLRQLPWVSMCSCRGVSRKHCSLATIHQLCICNLFHAPFHSDCPWGLGAQGPVEIAHLGLTIHLSLSFWERLYFSAMPNPSLHCPGDEIIGVLSHARLYLWFVRYIWVNHIALLTELLFSHCHYKRPYYFSYADPYRSWFGVIFSNRIIFKYVC